MDLQSAVLRSVVVETFKATLKTQHKLVEFAHQNGMTLPEIESCFTESMDALPKSFHKDAPKRGWLKEQYTKRGDKIAPIFQTKPGGALDHEFIDRFCRGG